VGGREFLHLSRLALGTTQPPVQWVPGLSRGVKSGQGVTLTPHPLLVLWSRKGRAIPLLPLWAVQPVQSLSACTRVHFIFYLCLLDNLQHTDNWHSTSTNVLNQSVVQHNYSKCICGTITCWSKIYMTTTVSMLSALVTITVKCPWLIKLWQI